MKRFRFNLQAVMSLWQRVEQEALERYATTLLSRRRALDRLEAVQGELNAAWRRVRIEMDGGCRAGTAAQLRDFCQGLEDRQKKAAILLAQADRAVSQALEKMQSARRNREAMEKHLQLQRARHALESSREEQKMLDDIANLRVAAALAREAAHEVVE